ncbi:hypothetical protein KA005_04610 [bacterium]|nr:hypothetical protein [bacterium]
MSDLNNAVGEAKAYNRMGGLDEQMLKDIAYDFGVDPRDILDELGWGRDYYDGD